MGNRGGVVDEQVEIHGQQGQQPLPHAPTEIPFPLQAMAAPQDQQQVEIGTGPRLPAGAGAEQPDFRHLRIPTQALQGLTDLRRFQPRPERPEGRMLREGGVGHGGTLGGVRGRGWGVLALGGRGRRRD